MCNSDIVLSILVISHNQVKVLPRCLDSILGQHLNVKYEIVVSDDRSTDGTWELIKRYEERYPDVVRGIKCDSDECNPVTRSERCGWNKATAYKNARGEFFVNIDADDYLKSDDIYQKQLDTLIENPDCVMCQQRVWQVDDGAPLESGHAWPDAPFLKDGMKMGPRYIILNDLQGLNQTYMTRRNKAVDPIALYGKWYDDTIITLHHLQFGKVVFIDRADYVWVQYSGSISNSYKGDDLLVSYALLPYQNALLVPKFSDIFVSKDNLRLVNLLKKSIFHKIQLSPITKQYMAQFQGFIFHYYVGRQSRIMDKIRLARILIIYKQTKTGGKRNKKADEKLRDLLLGE